MPGSAEQGRESGPHLLRVLLVEPAAGGAAGLSGTLEDLRGEVEVERVGDLTSALARLARGGIDLVLLDLDLPDSHGLPTFERAQAFAPELPIVVLTHSEDPELAVVTLRSGAQDFLVKGETGPELLRRSIRYAVERHRLTSVLRSLSLIDDLTGLYNRRGFSELGEQHLKLARRSNKALLLVYLDVDRLKAINDTMGHHVGDQALVRVAEILRETFRQSDILARIGGDEFAVLALEAAQEGEAQVVARLQGKVRAANHESPAPFELSVSVGTARFANGQPSSLSELLRWADLAMYRQKRAGRMEN